MSQDTTPKRQQLVSKIAGLNDINDHGDVFPELALEILEPKPDAEHQGEGEETLPNHRTPLCSGNFPYP